MAVADPTSYTGGTQLTIPQALPYFYDAGFRSPEELMSIVGIAIAESSMRVKARNWHPEYGFRPESDTTGLLLGLITPTAPDGAYSAEAVTPHDNVPTPATGSPYVQQLHSDRGILQISSWWYLYHPSAILTYADSICDDPTTAAEAGFEIYSHPSTTGFNEWDTYDNESAQAHFYASVNGWPAIYPYVTTYLSNKQGITRRTIKSDRRGFRMGMM
jgi:hypothetical protein